jgi:hypothetical protein
MISKDLGMDEPTTLKHLKEHMVYVYVDHQHGGHRMLGVATVQIIKEAYRMKGLQDRSTTPTIAVLGIGILWTHPSARRRGIATRLVSAARQYTVFGVTGPIDKSLVAFSSPTQAGYNFATKYCSTSRSGDGGGSSPNRSDEQQEQDQPLVYEM